MKKLILILISFTAMEINAQEHKLVPQINVSAEGKVFTTPDQAYISVAIETKGKISTEIKKQNDEKTEAVLKFIKKMNIAKEDFKTQQVSMSPQYDYNTKKYSYYASQTIEINLKDLSKYNELMEGIVNAGISQINNVEFRTSKKVALETDARKLAIKNAKQKAEDYVSVLGQKIGKALTITDNTQTSFPHPVAYAQMKSMSADDEMPRETLATGQIEITANVSVSFSLE